MSIANYIKQIWKDYPDKTTKITAARLNHMEDGIYQNNQDNIALNTSLSQFSDNGKVTNFSVGEDGSPYITYKVGADSVTKKLGSGSYEFLLVDHFFVENNGWSKVELKGEPSAFMLFGYSTTKVIYDSSVSKTSFKDYITASYTVLGTVYDVKFGDYMKSNSYHRLKLTNENGKWYLQGSRNYDDRGNIGVYAMILVCY